MKKEMLVCNLLVFILITFFTIGASQAAIVTLSDFSSDETPAEYLDAAFEFLVNGSVLTLNVTNTTSEQNAYSINEIYFNAKDNIDGLALNPAIEGWELIEDQKADGFGKFGFEVADGVGNDKHMIDQGEMLTFTFDITGTGPFTDFDFITLSTIPPGHIQAIAAAKFVGGPEGDGAYGSAIAAVPIPGALWLLGSGLVSIVGLRRKNTYYKKS